MWYKLIDSHLLQEEIIVKQKQTLNIFLLAMINVAAICSIKNWSITAEYGLSSLFYFLISIIGFFLPVSFVSAELATGWSNEGGIYAWVKVAMGHRLGFLATWLLWIENVVWYPTILSFIAGTIAFCFNPMLAHHTGYLFCMILGIFWLATLINLLGMKISGWMSCLGVMIGTIIPGMLIIGLGLLWLLSGKHSHIDFTWNALIPNLSNPRQLSLLTGVLLGFAGMEMSAVHGRDVKNSQRNYPRAILFSALIIILFSLLGTLAIAIVIPREEINLVSGGIEAIAFFLNTYHLGWIVPVIAFMVALGALGGVSTWAAGPSKGLLAAAQDGDFPPILHKVNKNNMPIGMLIFQGIIVTLISLLFLFMPNVNSSFWILLVLASQLYLIMYILMFIAGIILRYKKPHVPRAYKIPFGNVGMWILSGIGIMGAFFALVMGFFPPDQVEIGNRLFVPLFLIGGIIFFCAIPFMILFFKKPSWC